MSLYVYTDKSEIPNDITLINDNDTFFDLHTYLIDCEFIRYIIEEIDGSGYVDTETFKSGFNDDIIPRTYLSTGAKTIINVYHHPKNYCFNLTCCGNNALEALFSIRDGHVFWELPVVMFSLEDESCDIVFRGINYTNVFDFLDEVERLYYENEL